MSKFSEKLRMKGKVEEDLYFAKRDRELLEAMKRERLAKALDIRGKKKKKACDELEDDFTEASKRYQNKPKKLAKLYQNLLKQAKKI